MASVEINGVEKYIQVQESRKWYFSPDFIVILPSRQTVNLQCKRSQHFVFFRLVGYEYHQILP